MIAFVPFLSWFAIVITGRQPASLHHTRADALIFLITETYPPISDNS